MGNGDIRSMRGVVLPGDSTAQVRDFPIPEPAHGQVLIEVKASSICGSDVRAIYREHLGTGAEGYRNVIAGHEPAGLVVAVGEGVRRLAPGSRVLVYHIQGCGSCAECQRGYMIGCTSPDRAAYGWQRDGGHAQYMVAEETACIELPDELSYLDGALVSCGFGTAYEALLRARVSGLDSVLVVGLGPVGLAVAMLARAMGAQRVVGLDIVPERRQLAESLGVVSALADSAGDSADERFSVVIECSGSGPGRAAALARAAGWGRVVFVGEGPHLDAVDVSQQIIHKQLTIHGSWVTSLPNMADLVTRLAQWELKPSAIVTHTFPLEDADEAYRVASDARAGKVSIVMEAS